VPGAGAYSYLRRLFAGRRIPTHLALLRLATAIGTTAVVGAFAMALWLAPWPVDAVTTVATAVAWTWWLDHREQA
jgi:hypothetical protein